MSEYNFEDDEFLDEHHPTIHAAKPRWAEDRPDYIAGINQDGSIAINYTRELSSGDVSAHMFAEATYDPKAKRVNASSPFLAVGFGKSELVDFASPDEVRAAAAFLTVMADAFAEKLR